MAYADFSRSCKRGQTGQLSMDEQLAAVVLTTLSGRPASLPGGGSGAPASSILDLRSAGFEGVHAGWPLEAPDASSSSTSVYGYPRGFPGAVSELRGSEDTIVSAGTTSSRYMCSWKGCGAVTVSCSEIVGHIRQMHLRSGSKYSDREEDFYYVELDAAPTDENRLFNGAECPTMHHLCSGPEISASLPHDSVLFDHDYQKKSCKAFSKECSTRLKTILPSSMHHHSALLPISSSGQDQAVVEDSWRRKPSNKLCLSGLAKKGDKHDMKKCRKVYGVTNKRLWCTQCKWKKACRRFMLRT